MCPHWWVSRVGPQAVGSWSRIIATSWWYVTTNHHRRIWSGEYFNIIIFHLKKNTNRLVCEMPLMILSRWLSTTRQMLYNNISLLFFFFSFWACLIQNLDLWGSHLLVYGVNSRIWSCGVWFKSLLHLGFYIYQIITCIEIWFGLVNPFVESNSKGG